MVDTVDTATRSRMMAAIRGRGTRPEQVVEALLRRQRERFQMHDARLPGKPDFVLADRRAVIRVHGCFWHMHGCEYARVPTSRRDFWQRKLTANKARDEAQLLALVAQRWRVLTVWECALRGAKRWRDDELVGLITVWLSGAADWDEVAGRPVHRPSREPRVDPDLAKL